jgi:hypothetical protein
VFRSLIFLRKRLMSDELKAQDCELEYWNQQAEDYALVQIPCEDLRAIINRAWEAPAFNSALTAAEARAKAAETLVRVLLDNDPNELAADGGITVLDVWRKDAARTLKGAPDER